MSYHNCQVWTIIPKDSFKIIRNCPKCSCKSKYINTMNFRVNANGKAVDVWLIYQCEKCKSTLNIEIYERVHPNKISGSEYKRFLANDKDLALRYGIDKMLFRNNKVEIETEEITYEILEHIEGTDIKDSKGQHIIIKNPYQLKLRLDKLIAEQLNIPRMKVKKLIEQRNILEKEGSALRRYFAFEVLEIKIIYEENQSDIV